MRIKIQNQEEGWKALMAAILDQYVIDNGVDPPGVATDAVWLDKVCDVVGTTPQKLEETIERRLM